MMQSLRLKALEIDEIVRKVLGIGMLIGLYLNIKRTSS